MQRMISQVEIDNQRLRRELENLINYLERKKMSSNKRSMESRVIDSIGVNSAFSVAGTDSFRNLPPLVEIDMKLFNRLLQANVLKASTNAKQNN